MPSTRRYAQDTSVSTDRSKAEIEGLLIRYGADQFAYAWDGSKAIIGFRLKGRQVKIILPLPDRNHREFTHHSRGERTPAAALEAWEKACRQRWRALVLVVKAKLEAVDIGISTLESEFLASIVLPNGQTVGQWTQPQIETAYRTGQMPALLPGSNN